MKNHIGIWFAGLLLAVVAVCVAFSGTASPSPYAYDESDYMYAGTQGLWANYTDSGAMSLYEFVSKGWELSRDKTRRVSMSQYVRSLNDISFYRHYHGPLYAYWLGLCSLFGVNSEAGYRASGLILHAFCALAIFWLFLRAFPKFPPSAAFVAALMFLMNRTTLSAGTMITQHVVYEVISVLCLFALSRYLETDKTTWWYASVIFVAASFAAVEISVVLLGAVLTCLAFHHWGQWRLIAGRIGKGTLVFLATLLVIWPPSILQLNLIKGYLYLAYIAVYRKTFSPIGPMDLWGFKLTTYPAEFVIPLLVLIGVVLFWKKLQLRWATLPFLIYAVFFVGVTMVVTAPYAYYHASLLAATAVLTGVAFGEISERFGKVGRVSGLLAIAASLLVLDLSFYAETKVTAAAPQPNRSIINYLAQSTAAGPVFASYILVPTVHFYQPALPVIGYDADWTAQRLAEESLAAAPARVLCTEALCNQVSALWPESVRVNLKRELAGKTDDGEPVFAVFVTRE